MPSLEKIEIHQKAAEFHAVPLQIGDGLGDVLGEAGADIVGWVAVEVRRRHCADMRRHAARLERGGRHFRHRFRVAVIGGLGDDEAGPASEALGQPQCKVVALASRAGEDDIGKPAREGRKQPLRVVVHVVVQIARVGVQRGGLLGDRFHHARMAMSDRSDIVVDVEIAAAICIEHPNALGADHSDRPLIDQNGGSAEGRLPPRDERCELGV